MMARTGRYCSTRATGLMVNDCPIRLIAWSIRQPSACTAGPVPISFPNGCEVEHDQGEQWMHGEHTMKRWSEFAAEAPDMAEAGRALLYQFRVGLGYLATVRRDG